ncbi:unnamed protein product [Microthlaspi erraticum]|uniref:Secreted protein n=1 Tax=Microthlaspi erraticum TaxID=1685480 RepID=A0A6D2J0A8_9BRAS|nr:unnamed protein product [Microthlaspi erraticum]
MLWFTVWFVHLLHFFASSSSSSVFLNLFSAASFASAAVKVYVTSVEIRGTMVPCRLILSCSRSCELVVSVTAALGDLFVSPGCEGWIHPSNCSSCLASSQRLVLPLPSDWP